MASDRLLPLALLGRPNLELNLDHLLALFDPRLRLYVTPLPFVGAERVRQNTVVDFDHAGNIATHAGPFEVESELKFGARELARAMRTEMEAALARQCAGARRVAVLTGGGVDSSNLLALAVHNARHRNTASVIPVSLDVGGPGDDRPYLRLLCNHLGIEPLRVAPADGADYPGQDRIIDASAHATAPLSSMIAILTRAKAAGAERAFVGDGSEMLLDAQPAVFGDFVLREPLQALRSAIRYRAIYQTRARSWRTMVVGPLLRTLVPALAIGLRERQAHRATAAQSLRQALWMGPRLRDFVATRRHYPKGPPIQSQAARVRAAATSNMLGVYPEFTARWEVLADLPMSYPYLDDDFVRFAGRIPSAAIFAGDRERGLLRESMEDLVPDQVRYRMDKARGDHGFAELFCAMGSEAAVGDLLSMRELEKLGIVDPGPFARAFAAFAADPYADPMCWLTLWSAITAEAYVRWFTTFRSGGSAASEQLSAADGVLS